MYILYVNCKINIYFRVFYYLKYFFIVYGILRRSTKKNTFAILSHFCFLFFRTSPISFIDCNAASMKLNGEHFYHGVFYMAMLLKGLKSGNKMKEFKNLIKVGKLEEYSKNLICIRLNSFNIYQIKLL